MKMRRALQATVQQLKSAESGFEDGGGDCWEDWQTVPMQIRPLNGREYLASEQMQSQVTHLGRSKYLPGTGPEMRIVYEGTKYNVQSVVNEMGRNRFLVWRLIEVTSGRQ